MEFIDGVNEECEKQKGSFKYGSSSKQEAARAVVAACGDAIMLHDADDSQLMTLGPAMAASPIVETVKTLLKADEAVMRRNRVFSGN